MSGKATCKNCKKPIKKLNRGVSGVQWTHDVLMTDNQIGCISTTVAEPKEARK